MHLILYVCAAGNPLHGGQRPRKLARDASNSLVRRRALNLEGHTAKRSKYGPAPGTSYAKLDSQPDLWEEDLPEADLKLEAQLGKLSRKVRAQGGRVVHSNQLSCGALLANRWCRDGIYTLAKKNTNLHSHLQTL